MFKPDREAIDILFSLPPIHVEKHLKRITCIDNPKYLNIHERIEKRLLTDFSDFTTANLLQQPFSFGSSRADQKRKRNTKKSGKAKLTFCKKSRQAKFNKTALNTIGNTEILTPDTPGSGGSNLSVDLLSSELNNEYPLPSSPSMSIDSAIDLSHDLLYSEATRKPSIEHFFQEQPITNQSSQEQPIIGQLSPGVDENIDFVKSSAASHNKSFEIIDINSNDLIGGIDMSDNCPTFHNDAGKVLLNMSDDNSFICNSDSRQPVDSMLVKPQVNLLNSDKHRQTNNNCTLTNETLKNSSYSDLSNMDASVSIPVSKHLEVKRKSQSIYLESSKTCLPILKSSKSHETPSKFSEQSPPAVSKHNIVLGDTSKTANVSCSSSGFRGVPTHSEVRVSHFDDRSKKCGCENGTKDISDLLESTFQSDQSNSSNVKCSEYILSKVDKVINSSLSSTIDPCEAHCSHNIATNTIHHSVEPPSVMELANNPKKYGSFLKDILAKLFLDEKKKTDQPADENLQVMLDNSSTNSALELSEIHCPDGPAINSFIKLSDTQCIRDCPVNITIESSEIQCSDDAAVNSSFEPPKAPFLEESVENCIMEISETQGLELSANSTKKLSETQYPEKYAFNSTKYVLDEQTSDYSAVNSSEHSETQCSDSLFVFGSTTGLTTGSTIHNSPQPSNTSLPDEDEAVTSPKKQNSSKPTTSNQKRFLKEVIRKTIAQSNRDLNKCGADSKEDTDFNKNIEIFKHLISSTLASSDDEKKQTPKKSNKDPLSSRSNCEKKNQLVSNAWSIESGVGKKADADITSKQEKEKLPHVKISTEPQSCSMINKGRENIQSTSESKLKERFSGNIEYPSKLKLSDFYLNKKAPTPINSNSQGTGDYKKTSTPVINKWNESYKKRLRGKTYGFNLKRKHLKASGAVSNLVRDTTNHASSKNSKQVNFSSHLKDTSEDEHQKTNLPSPSMVTIIDAANSKVGLLDGDTESAIHCASVDTVSIKGTECTLLNTSISNTTLLGVAKVNLPSTDFPLDDSSLVESSSSDDSDTQSSRKISKTPDCCVLLQDVLKSADVYFLIDTHAEEKTDSDVIDNEFINQSNQNSARQTCDEHSNDFRDAVNTTKNFPDLDDGANDFVEELAHIIISNTTGGNLQTVVTSNGSDILSTDEANVDIHPLVVPNGGVQSPEEYINEAQSVDGTNVNVLSMDDRNVDMQLTEDRNIYAQSMEETYIDEQLGDGSDDVQLFGSKGIAIHSREEENKVKEAEDASINVHRMRDASIDLYPMEGAEIDVQPIEDISIGVQPLKDATIDVRYVEESTNDLCGCPRLEKGIKKGKRIFKVKKSSVLRNQIFKERIFIPISNSSPNANLSCSRNIKRERFSPDKYVPSSESKHYRFSDAENITLSTHVKKFTRIRNCTLTPESDKSDVECESQVSSDDNRTYETIYRPDLESIVPTVTGSNMPFDDIVLSNTIPILYTGSTEISVQEHRYCKSVSTRDTDKHSESSFNMASDNEYSSSKSSVKDSTSVIENSIPDGDCEEYDCDFTIITPYVQRGEHSEWRKCMDYRSLKNVCNVSTENLQEDETESSDDTIEYMESESESYITVNNEDEVTIIAEEDGRTSTQVEDDVTVLNDKNENILLIEGNNVHLKDNGNEIAEVDSENSIHHNEGDAMLKSREGNSILDTSESIHHVISTNISTNSSKPLKRNMAIRTSLMIVRDETEIIPCIFQSSHIDSSTTEGPPYMDSTFDNTENLQSQPKSGTSRLTENNQNAHHQPYFTSSTSESVFEINKRIRNVLHNFDCKEIGKYISSQSSDQSNTGTEGISLLQDSNSSQVATGSVGDSEIGSSKCKPSAVLQENVVNVLRSTCNDIIEYSTADSEYEDSPKKNQSCRTRFRYARKKL